MRWCILSKRTLFPLATRRRQVKRESIVFSIDFFRIYAIFWMSVDESHGEGM